MIRTYSELKSFQTFHERYDYLKLRGSVGNPTFGSDRWMNQEFYRSAQWKHVRQFVIARDLGMDLAMLGYEIYDTIYIHHMNPMSMEDLINGDTSVLDPEYLITTTHRTHNAIHYGDANLLSRPFVERVPGDTNLW